jgi:multiple sugar transport system substrate-binding protein
MNMKITAIWKLTTALATAAMISGLAFAQVARAETITVLIPSFGDDAAARQVIASFTKDTGIDVELQSLPWDDIRPKIVTAMLAGTAPADVTEFDWSWVGQFGAAQWYTPLDGKFDPSLIADMPTTSVFTYDGALLGIPYANDFRMHSINTAYFKSAGITTLPTTPAELTEAARALKQKKVVDFPISIPLSATEGTSTAWYFATRMFGGELFDKDWKPLFVEKGSPGYKALEWVASGLKEGLINPAMTANSDQEVTDAFAHGAAAIDIAGHPGDNAQYNDKTRATIMGDASFILTGADPAKLMTIGLPEALAIPVNSEHKEAAMKFIQWWSDHQEFIYATVKVLPSRTSVLQTLSDKGGLMGGKEIAEYSPYTQAIFPQGTPPWYSEFSSSVSSTINQLAKGQIGVDDAVKQIGDRAQSLSQQ